MHSTKKVAAKRPAKRPARTPAKKAYHKVFMNLVDKLLKLKYRINDAYRNNDFEFTKDDKDFVIGLIHNIRKRQQKPSKIQMVECNKLWNKYAK